MTTQRATCWSVTINNPTDDDTDAISLARQKGWIVEGQLEQGESGTPHYQLMVKTPQVRFSALKKTFPRAHIEVAKNESALRAYVGKEESRVAPLPEQSNQYPSLSKLWTLLYDYIRNVLPPVPNEHRLMEREDKAFRFYWSEGQWYMSFNDRRIHRRFCDPDRSRRLELFDDFIRCMIGRGYRVETLAVNPQVRSCFQNYFMALMEREHRAIMAAENSTELNLPEEHNPDGDEEENSPPPSSSPPPPDGAAPDANGSSGSA